MHRLQMSYITMIYNQMQRRKRQPTDKADDVNSKFSFLYINGRENQAYEIIVNLSRYWFAEYLINSDQLQIKDGEENGGDDNLY